MLYTFRKRHTVPDDNDWGRTTLHHVRRDIPWRQAVHIWRSPVQEIAIADLERFGKMLLIRVRKLHEKFWPQFAMLDEHVYHQLLVIWALASIEDATDGIILGGSDLLAAFRVFMRRGVDRLRIVDWDTLVGRMVRTYIDEVKALGIQFDPRLTGHKLVTDARDFLREAPDEIASFVIGDLVDLKSLEDFLPGFADHIFRILRRGGVFVTQLGPMTLVPHDLSLTASAVRSFQKRFGARSVAIAAELVESSAYAQGVLFAWKGVPARTNVLTRDEFNAKFIPEAIRCDRPFYLNPTGTDGFWFNPRIHNRIFTLDPTIHAALAA